MVLLIWRHIGSFQVIIFSVDFYEKVSVLLIHIERKLMKKVKPWVNNTVKSFKFRAIKFSRNADSEVFGANINSRCCRTYIRARACTHARSHTRTRSQAHTRAHTDILPSYFFYETSIRETPESRINAKNVTGSEQRRYTVHLPVL